MVDFPAQLADEIDAQGLDRRRPHADRLARQPRECFVRKIAVGELGQHIARTRPGQHQHAHRGRQPLIGHRAIGRQRLLQVIMVMPLISACRDEIILVDALLVDGKFAAHPALGGQQIRQRHPAALLGHRVGEQAIQPFLRARAGDHALGKGAHVLQADLFRHMAAFRAHELEIVRAPERPFLADRLAFDHRVVFVEDRVGLVEIGLAQFIALGREPARTLPAINAAEHRAQRRHPVMTRHPAQRARRLALFIGVMDREDLGIGLLVLFDEIALARIRPKAARIDAHHVDRGLAIDDPFGQLPPGAPGRGNAEGMAFVEPQPLLVPRRADDGRTIRRISDGAVIDLLDADLAKGWHARHRRQDVRLETLKRVGEEFIFAIRRRALHIAGRRADFIRPEQQAAGLLTHIPAGIRLAQHAHFGQALGAALHDRGVLFGDDILMFDRDDRDIEPNHSAGLPGEIAGGRDDMLSCDLALVSGHHPLAIALLRDRGDGGVAIDRGAALARALGQCLRQVSGLDIAIIRMLDRAQNAVRLGQRPDVLDLVWRQEFDIDADRLGNARIILVLIHAVLAGRQTDVRDAAKADVQLRLGFQRGVEIDRILVQLADRIGQVEQGQQPRRMPCRARGQLLALNQNHIRPAQFGQMVQRRYAHHTAADHYHACCCLHGRLQSCCCASIRYYDHAGMPAGGHAGQWRPYPWSTLMKAISNSYSIPARALV